MSIPDFSQRFLTDKLRTAFCVFSDENEVGAFLKYTGSFKAWVAHDWILLDHKNRDAINVKGRGICVFCANELPSLKLRTKRNPFTGVSSRSRSSSGTSENASAQRSRTTKSIGLEILEYVARKAL